MANNGEGEKMAVDSTVNHGENHKISSFTGGGVPVNQILKLIVRDNENVYES